MQRKFLLMSLIVAVWIHNLLNTLAFWSKACPQCCSHLNCWKQFQLLHQHSVAILSQLCSGCCNRVRGLEPFFPPHSSGAKTLINEALQQIIKQLPFQHSSLQASGGTLQGLFLEHKSRMCAKLGITATPGGTLTWFYCACPQEYSLFTAFLPHYQIWCMVYKEQMIQVLTDLAHHMSADLPISSELLSSTFTILQLFLLWNFNLPSFFHLHGRQKITVSLS